MEIKEPDNNSKRCSGKKLCLSPKWKKTDTNYFEKRIDHDLWGNPTDIIYHNGYVKWFERDGQGRVKSVVENYFSPRLINKYNYKK